MARGCQSDTCELAQDARTLLIKSNTSDFGGYGLKRGRAPCNEATSKSNITYRQGKNTAGSFHRHTYNDMVYNFYALYILRLPSDTYDNRQDTM